MPINVTKLRSNRLRLAGIGAILVVCILVPAIFFTAQSRSSVTATPTPVVAAALNTPTAQPADPSPARGQGVGGPQHQTPTPSVTATSSPTPPASTPTPTRSMPSPTATATETPLAPALQSLRTLQGAIVPARDPYALAARLKPDYTGGLRRTSDKAPGNYAVGHIDTFNVSDVETRNYYKVRATIRLVTEHVYWYVQDGQSYDGAALKRVSDAFENKIYPTDRAVFGSEWTPGVDNDPRITVLFAPLQGAGGSYSAADEYTRAVNPFSNEREMIYISTKSGWGGLESTLAHEFQHMIHWHMHPNQDIWLNEGSSMLASALNGYDVQGTDGDFMRDPNVQLNAWQPNPTLARANYGASLLFVDYLRAHYGGDKTLRAIVTAPEPGTDAVSSALAQAGYADRFTDVFKKWAIANLVSGHAGAPAEYNYADREVQVSPQGSLDNYPTGYSGQTNQFGASYIELKPPSTGNKLHVDFAGQPEVQAIAAPAHSGTHLYWSNRGDLSDTTMTRRFDLRGLSKATLGVSLSFDIERDFDYAYLEASTDNGATWSMLKGKYTSASNPNGTNYGNAYTGASKDLAGADKDGWVHERIDLTPYAGKEILLRAEYITDDGYNAQGFALDDISIPELGYTDDAERGTGWQTDGFVRIANTLPQNYFLAVVRFNNTGVSVSPISLSAANEASFNVEEFGPGSKYNRAVLVVAGLTTYTLQHAAYDLSVRP